MITPEKVRELIAKRWFDVGAGIDPGKASVALNAAVGDIARAYLEVCAERDRLAAQVEAVRELATDPDSYRKEYVRQLMPALLAALGLDPR